MTQLRPTRVVGFTLIEVLVVVAIIALLVSILIPSLARAREQARKTVCLSNVKQLATAFFYYTGDHGGKMPHYNHWLYTGDPHDPSGNYPVPQSGQLMGLQTKLSPRHGRNYAKDPGIYKCPSDKGARTSVGAGGYRPIMPPTFSYTVNTYVMKQAGYAVSLNQDNPPDPLSQPLDYMPLHRVKRPSDTPLLIEEYEYSPMNDGYFVSGKPDAGDALWDRITTRHGGRTFYPEVTVVDFGKAVGRDNYGIGTLAYFDFHASAVRSAQFNASYNLPDQNRGQVIRHHFLTPGVPLPAALGGP